MRFSDANRLPTSYQGPDRRQRTPHVAGRPLPLNQLLWAGNAVVVAGAVLGLAFRSSGAALPLQLHHFFVGVTAILLLLAGTLTLLRWSRLGTYPTALLGTAFLVLALRAALEPFGPALADGPWDAAAGTLPRLLIAMPALFLLIRMTRRPNIVASIRPVRIAVTAAVFSTTATIALACATAAHHLPAPRAAVLAMVNVLLCSGWFVAAGVVQRTRRLRAAAGGQWAPVACGGLGISCALSALVTVSPTFLSAADAAALFAAGVAAIGAYADARAVLVHEDRDRLRLTLDLEVTASRFESEQFRMEERLHDLRSAVAAVRSATTTLQRYKERLDPDAAHGLEVAIVAEYGRLEHLTGPLSQQTAEEAEIFVLNEVLTPVIVAERSAGSTILTDLSAPAVRGDRCKTAEIVQNLLVNARRYAPGCTITVVTRQLGQYVQIEIEDAGWGIPESERVGIFRRGVRGSNAAGVEGTGLGLFIAARLASEQGGKLTLRTGGSGGACFVLALPAAAGAAAAERSERALIA